MLCIYVNKKETTFLRGDKENLREREKEENDCYLLKKLKNINFFLQMPDLVLGKVRKNQCPSSHRFCAIAKTLRARR